MDDAFELFDPHAAQVFLQRFPTEARRKGEACFRRGGVISLVPEKTGESFSALVTDGFTYQVALTYNSQAHWSGASSWSGLCGCRKSEGCEHVFATMSAVLAEYNTVTVRRLSSSLPDTRRGPAPAKPKAQPPRGDELAHRLKTALGRELEREESTFVRKVHATYERCRQMRSISFWDFEQMGLPMPGYGNWEALELWPAFPTSDFEFWLYIAHHLLKEKLRIPGFMEPVTDLSVIEGRLARWQRTREIQKWKQTFESLELRPGARVSPESEATDLRLVIDEDEVRLQWRRPGQAQFEPVKQTQVRRLDTDYEAGLVRFTPEAEVLWQVFAHRNDAYSGLSPKIDFQDDDGLRTLGPLLRIPLLESRIVDAQGRPLARRSEPLRWEIIPAANEDEDYRFRLVQADGTPPPRILGVVSDKPAFYITATALYVGPEPGEEVLDPAGETRIPAPALEQTAGVTFLQSLGIEPPARIRDRIRVLDYDVVIQCELKKPLYGWSEECIVQVRAEAPDGQAQVWTGADWQAATKPRARRKGEDDARLVVYGAAKLARVQGLLEPLRLGMSRYGNGLGVAVGKKFPETFGAWLKSIPPDIAVQLKGELASFAASEVAGRVKLEVTEAEIDWFDLRVVLDVADTTLTAAEIKLLLNAKGKYVRLAGKGWRRLQYDLSEDENERLARLGLSPRELSAEPQRLHALQLADEAAKKFLPEQQVEQIQRRISELKTRVAPDLPAGVTAQLRPYQLEGFHFLAYLATNRFSGILADDMGLGKTLQTLAWVLWLRQEERADWERRHPASESGLAETRRQEAGAPSATTASSAGDTAAAETVALRREPLRIPPVLVVCPKSVMDNWHAEAARFTPALHVRVWSASELDGLRDELPNADVHVLNYSQLRMLGETLVPVRWLAVILDEGQYIKNPNSQTAQVARALRTERRLVLTGTPIENRLLDLWSLMAFAMPGVLGSRAQFARLYDAKDDPYARRRLASRVRPFVLRRTKAQVAKDLPDRVEEDLFCEIEGEQQMLYRAELKRAQQLLLGIKTQKELAQQQFHFLTSLLRLRQICCHPRLLKHDSPAASAKTEALLEQLEPLMEEGQKVLVFSQFVEMLHLLRPALLERNWPIFYLAGETENRGELVRDFQAAKGPAVFLISLKAGGFGLNLTAASYVVLFDPWWNPAVENQAIDRTHRIGQNNKVIAYRLLIKNSIEEKIRELQKQKKALAEDVLGEEKFAQSLTLHDLQFLFAD